MSSHASYCIYRFLTSGPRTDNQFIAHRVPVKEHVKAGENSLVLTFASAFRKVRLDVCSSVLLLKLPMAFQGREIEEQHEKLNLWNGDSSRLHVRKAQYKYVPIGIGPSGSTHIADLHNAAMAGTGVCLHAKNLLTRC